MTRISAWATAIRADRILTRGRLVFCGALLSVLYAAWGAFIKGSPYLHGDTRWFYAAGTCLNQGQIPYAIDNFRRCWFEWFVPEHFSPYVFAPISLPFASFIAAFPWDVGKWVFIWINLISVFLMVAMTGRAMLRLTDDCKPFGWLLFACLAGSLSGTVTSGQGVIVAALGFVLALNGLLYGSTILLVLGTVLATFKFHITPLYFLVLYFVTPREMIAAKVLAILATAISFLLPVIIFGPHAMTQIVGSLEEHFRSPFAHFGDANRMSTLYGIPSVLHQLGVGKLLSVVIPCLTAVVVLSAAIRAGGRQRMPDLLMLAASFGLFVVPVKTYDFAVAVPAMALTGLTSRPWLVAPGVIVLWRPEALARVLSSATELPLRAHEIVLVALAWIIVVQLCGLLFERSRRVTREERAV